MKWLGIICLLISFAALAEPSLKIEMPVEKYTLKNGLTVLLLEDHSVPMVSYHTWYKVGSRDEHEGITGSAHMLEHMMFQGAKKYSGTDFHRIMDENGVEWNAFTSNDYTGFYMNLPASKLDLIMEVEVDRMSSLAIAVSNLKSEHEVVKEERRMRVDNNPFGMLHELSMSSIFKVSHDRWPVIGYMKDIDAYTPETLRSFYEKYYVPNNAILVIVGDFQASHVKRMIESYYGKLPPKPLEARTYPSEPPQKKQINATLKKDVQAISFEVAYRGTPPTNPDVYALDLAASVLGSGTSSRLHHRLVYESEIAASADASHRSLADEGIFSVWVSMKPGKDMQAALDIVYNEIFKLRNKPVSDSELRKAKALLMKGYVDGMTTMDGKARSLVTAEITMGSYQSIFTDLEKYQAVTAEDIRRVANKYLNQGQRSLIVLEPKVKKAEASTPGQAPAKDEVGK